MSIIYYCSSQYFCFLLLVIKKTIGSNFKLIEWHRLMDFILEDFLAHLRIIYGLNQVWYSPGIITC